MKRNHIGRRKLIQVMQPDRNNNSFMIMNNNYKLPKWRLVTKGVIVQHLLIQRKAELQLSKIKKYVES